MNGNDLKKALKIRHEAVHQQLPAAQAEEVLKQICALMGWDSEAAMQEVAARRPGEDCLAYLTHELRERLNQAKWEFVRAHPADPAAREIVALARSWQQRTRGQNQKALNREALDFPNDEEAYGQAEPGGDV